MIEVSPVGQVLVAIGLFVAALLTIMVITRPQKLALPNASRGSISFLFEGTQLLDATRPARDLLRSMKSQATDLEALVLLLSSQFPNLQRELQDIVDLGKTSIPSGDGDPTELLIEYTNGVTMISLVSESDQSAASISDYIISKTVRAEADALRTMADDSPQLMWRENDAQQITWANTAYMTMASQCFPEDDFSWPPKRLFENLSDDHSETVSRHALMPHDGNDPLWFDVTVNKSNGRLLFVAQDVTSVVRAEDVHRDIMQTLTKTFAGLSVGLAVFDQSRQLVMFNPALGDMTKLRPTDLISKPRLESFLDMLREVRIIPEPRDYAAWRRDMVDMENKAAQGEYVENWDIPDGRTFRVTGRPFPNGSLALFFEDISEETNQARKMSAAMKLGNDALDGVADAIAIFGPNRGDLLMSNLAYRKMWGPTTADTGQNITLDYLVGKWAEQCTNPDEWLKLVQARNHVTLGKRMMFTVDRHDGQRIHVTVRGLSDGSVSTVFVRAAESATDMTQHSIAI